MNERLILLRAPEPATPRARDAARLEALIVALEWRENQPSLNGPDEFGPLSGDRWHVILRRFLEGAGDSPERNRDAAELERLVQLLERDGTKVKGTQTLWADVLRRYARGDYQRPEGRPKQEHRDQLLARHYWLLRRIYPELNEDGCAEGVADVYGDAAARMTSARVKRIAKTGENKIAALQWIEEQLSAQPDHAPETVLRALLATYEPRAADEKLLRELSGEKVK